MGTNPNPRTTLKQVDDALYTLEEESRVKIKDLRESFSVVSKSVNDFSITQNKISSTVNGISTTQNGISKTVSDISITQNGISKTVSGVSYTQSGTSVTVSNLSKTVSDHSLTLAATSRTATVLTATLAAVTVGISLFKIDEKGLTILGATREWRLTKPVIEWVQKKIENKHQRDARAAKTLAENQLKDVIQDVDKIKEALRSMSQAAGRQGVAESRRPGPSPRGIDHASPTIKGVASDVRVLRAAVDSLSNAFA